VPARSWPRAADGLAAGALAQLSDIGAEAAGSSTVRVQPGEQPCLQRMERNVLGGGLQRDQHEHGTGWRAALIAAAVQSSKGPAGDECDGARPGVPGVVFSNCMAYCGGKPFRAGSSVRLPGYEQDILFPIQPPPFLGGESYLCIR
jgi:hypothetical protein